MKMEERYEELRLDSIAGVVEIGERRCRLSRLMRWSPHPLIVAHVLQAPATILANGNLHNRMSLAEPEVWSSLVANKNCCESSTRNGSMVVLKPGRRGQLHGLVMPKAQ